MGKAYPAAQSQYRFVFKLSYFHTLNQDMNIGFDAKRAYHNTTGLGVYSRTLITSLAQQFPEHAYYLFNPKKSSAFHFPHTENLREVLPAFPASLFPSAWRSSWIKKDLDKYNIDLYHGLSHEIPLGIQKTKIKTVVTIHDLIHERYPTQYNPIDVKIYHRKFKYACANADKVIAISQQTRQDIMDIYKIPGEKITVCYQSCNPIFSITVDEKEKKRVKDFYGLPDEYFLYVGSVIERKNLLSICKALAMLKDWKVPLVVIGDGDKYKHQVKEYITANQLENQVLFLSETLSSGGTSLPVEHFPAIYQSAIAMIYPSLFEGFGIPVLEALFSGLPVITSNVSSLPEAGGDAAWYVNPLRAEEIAAGMQKIYLDGGLRGKMKQDGLKHALHFTPEKCAAQVMEVYKSI